MQDCKDKSGFQFTKFDLVSGGKEIKIAIFEACEQPRVGVSRFVLGFTPVSCCSREELQPDGRFAASSLVCRSRLTQERLQAGYHSRGIWTFCSRCFVS